ASFSLVACVLFSALFTPTTAKAAECTHEPVLSSSAAEQWPGWGNGLANTRYSPDGIDSGDLASLKLRWAFGFDGVGSVVGNPVVHQNLVFIGVDSGELYALDAETACVHWVFQADNGVRTAPALALID